jgi:hypothetical protein
MMELWTSGDLTMESLPYYPRAKMLEKYNNIDLYVYSIAFISGLLNA